MYCHDIYRVIQKEYKIVHAYFLGLWCTMGAQTGGKTSLMPEHFENMHKIEKSVLTVQTVTTGKVWKFMDCSKITF